MTIISSAQDPTDRHDHLTEAQIGSPPHVIEFFTAGEQMFTESSGSVEPSSYRSELKRIPFRREVFLSSRISHPLEDSLYSLVSAAALASLLIWILSLPSVTATKTEPSKPRVISQMESSLLTQSRL